MRPHGLTSAAEKTECARAIEKKTTTVRQADLDAKCDAREIIVIETPEGTILLFLRKSGVERN
jgi:hypothetical protein